MYPSAPLRRALAQLALAALASAQHWTCPALKSPALGMSFAVTPAAVGAAASCDDKCLTLNNCCLGNASSCQMASCQQGCRIATVVPDEATCNATCINMTNHCDYKVGPFEFELCGGCSLKWLNPETLQPVCADMACPLEYLA